MTTITIVPESTGKDGIIYRAKAGTLQSEGRSAGEALDALTKQLDQAETGALVVIQQPPTEWSIFVAAYYEAIIDHVQRTLSGEMPLPDAFFTAAQQHRLSELMARWREARDESRQLQPEEQAELEQLINAEVQAATRRAESTVAEWKK
ncbi:MAG TPA: hypothetical protein VJ464_17315 [Blastocatellia bacterium]|nr:hypothetical protein [Blastocatellia bacterium]